MRPVIGPEELAPIAPYALLEHAWRRINAPDEEEIDSRRAVSDAFYALYHALTLAAVPHMTASDDPLEPYRRVRGIRHWHVRSAANAALANADERVRAVADVMLQLYTWREDADYGHLARFTRVLARDAIDFADEAVAMAAEPAFGASDLPRRLAAMLDAS